MNRRTLLYGLIAVVVVLVFLGPVAGVIDYSPVTDMFMDPPAGD